MKYVNQANKFSVRKQKGQEIAQINGHVKRIDEHRYKVKSQSNGDEYDVLNTELGFTCSCCDHIFRGVKCKHIYAVEFSLAVRKQVESNIIIIRPIDSLCCQFCNSKNFVKDAVRHNKYGDIQRYLCKECRKRFSINIGFEGMRVKPQIITSAMQLYFTGESFRNVKKFLELQGVKMSHVAIYKWITKYVGLMKNYLEQIKPNVSTAWRTDELFLKIKGNMKYLYALMDDETRFWIAQQVADTKYTANINPLFKQGKELTGKRPNTLISDGAPNFNDSFKKEFYTNTTPRIRHISHIRLQGDHNNNKMERLNGEVRDREKVMRGLKRKDTPILTGYQLFHNYVRQHEGLNGKTPSDVCGIKIEGLDKWMTIIQNASHALQSR
jgi:putative transposase